MKGNNLITTEREKRNAYIKEWKRKKRLQEGKYPRGKTPRLPRTPEQIEQSKQNRNAYGKLYNKLNPYHNIEIKQRMLQNAKRRAKAKGLVFDLVVDDIVIPKCCPYLGVTLREHAFRSEYRGDVASLDRIDSSKGYTKDNIEVISNLANSMKNGASKEELILFALEVLKRYA